VLVLSVSLPLAGLATYLVYNDVLEARARAEATVSDIARHVASDTHAFLGRTEERLRYLASRPMVRARDGRCDPMLAEMTRLNSTYAAVALIDARGKPVCSSLEPFPQIGYADREWYRHSSKAPGLYAGSPVLGRATEELIVPVSLALGGGESAGILVFATSLREIGRLVDVPLLPPGSVVAIVGADGKIVARSIDSERWAGREAADIASLASGMAMRDGTAILDGPDGVTRIHAFATVPGVGWLVSAALPLDAVMAPYRRRLAQSAAAAAATVALVMALALWLGARMRAPVLSLAEAAQAVRRGDYAKRAVEAGPAEIAAVAREFNRMARTRAAVEDSLKQRTAQLEAANRELEAFAYSVSHDLRAPLRAIDGFSQALLEDYEAQLDEEGRDSLRRVRAASQRMADLIDDMLKLSRATRGELSIERVDLSAIARSVVEELRQHTPRQDVTVRIQPGVYADADPRLIRAALENLLSNAWKFTARTAGARIEFGVERRDGTPACHVRDNGAGFDMAFAEGLFKPFQRLHRASEFPGSGIGLATVKRIVARLGGTIGAEGAVGRGATFWFTLPNIATEQSA
jgi:signal transduction histidine kinase